MMMMMMMMTMTTTMVIIIIIIIIIITTGIIPNESHESLKILNIRPALYTNAEGSKTDYIPYS
jgi:hypothetical protein